MCLFGVFDFVCAEDTPQQHATFWLLHENGQAHGVFELMPMNVSQTYEPAYRRCILFICSICASIRRYWALKRQKMADFCCLLLGNLLFPSHRTLSFFLPRSLALWLSRMACYLWYVLLMCAHISVSAHAGPNRTKRNSDFWIMWICCIVCRFVGFFCVDARHTYTRPRLPHITQALNIVDFCAFWADYFLFVFPQRMNSIYLSRIKTVAGFAVLWRSLSWPMCRLYMLGVVLVVSVCVCVREQKIPLHGLEEKENFMK